jgi:peptidoglycan-associated lipoprotein
MKVKGTNPRKMLCFLGLVTLVCAMVLVAGCGKKPEPQTEPEVAIEPIPETIRPPVEPEVPVDTPPAPDYTAMRPIEFGIEDVFFAFDRYDLDEQAMAVLGRNARILREHPEVRLLIEGHCDERGTIEYNLALGEKRAKAVRDHLARLGISSNRMRVTSYGKSRPFAMGSNEQAWAQNRRAHFARP